MWTHLNVETVKKNFQLVTLHQTVLFVIRVKLERMLIMNGLNLKERSKMGDDIKTPYDTKEVKDRVKKLNHLLKTDVALYNHLTRNGYIEYILNGDWFPYKQ